MSAFKKHQTAAANAVAEMIPKVIERIRSRDTVVELLLFARKNIQNHLISLEEVALQSDIIIDFCGCFH